MKIKIVSVVALSLTVLSSQVQAIPFGSVAKVGFTSENALTLIAADSRKDVQKKIDAQRKAVRDHIEKYNKYPNQQDKDFALKTIRHVQKNISALREKQPTISPSYEDTWNP